MGKKVDYCGMLHCGDLIGKMEGANCYCGEVCEGEKKGL